MRRAVFGAAVLLSFLIAAAPVDVCAGKISEASSAASAAVVHPRAAGPALAASVRMRETASDEESGVAAGGERYLEGLLEEMDFSGLDELLMEDLSGNIRQKVSFTDVVNALLEEGWKGFDLKVAADWLTDAIFYEIRTNRRLLVEVLLLAVGFSILKNFVGAFRSSYISDLCFLMVYCVLGVMLLQSFSVFGSVAAETMGRSVDFMKALTPTLSLAMVFSAGAGTGAGFYQTALLVIYLVQWIFLKLFVPLIQIYIILELFNHFFEDEKFGNLTELVNGLICWGMKTAWLLVLGLTVVQGMIAQAKDRLVGGGIVKAASMIPGIGNVINGAGQILLGSGILIKNCVGAAALIFLVAIGLIPMVKIACLAFFYKLTAAVTEPVADGRIAGCLKGMAAGGVLYLKLMGYCLVLFFLTIALTVSMSGVLM